MQSGKLRKLDELSSNDDLKTIDLFTKVWGAGPTTAQNWVRLGYKTLDDLKSDFNAMRYSSVDRRHLFSKIYCFRTKANLNKQQRIGLKYYDELLDRMPRSEAAEIEATVLHSLQYFHNIAVSDS